MENRDIFTGTGVLIGVLKPRLPDRASPRGRRELYLWPISNQLLQRGDARVAPNRPKRAH